MQRRPPEFSFPGSPARPPRPPVNAVLPRPPEEEEVRWLQASRQASPDYHYYNSSSGTPSPQLWSAVAQDRTHRPYPASAGSSPSRAQAIAGYRREMLDLVRGLPESAYELSLRDIVEHRLPSPSTSSPPSPSSPAPLPTPPPALPATPPPLASADAVAGSREPANAAAAAAGTADDHAAKKQSTKQGSKQQQSGAVRRQRSRSMERSVSLDTGLLIKFFVPLAIRGRKKKVSPKPVAAKDTSNKTKKKQKQGTKKEEARQQQQDEEWWSKGEFSETSGTSSRTSSSNSNGSVRNGNGNGTANGGSNPRAPARSRSRKRNGCYAFFRGSKTKNGVSQD